MKASNFIAVFASAILSSASPVPEEQGLGSYSPPADTPSDPTAPTWGSYTGGSGSGSGFGDIGGLGPEVPANGGSIFSPFPGGLPVGGAPQGYTGNTWPPKEYPADSPFSNGGFDKAADLCSNENSIDNAAISCCSQSGLPVIGGIIGGISGLGCTLNILSDICSQKSASIACCPTTGNYAGPLTLINLQGTCVPITIL